MLLIGPWRRTRTARIGTSVHRATAWPSTSCCASSAASTASSTSRSTASPRSTTGAARDAGGTSATAYGDAVCEAQGIEPSLRLRTDLRLGFEGGRARAETRLRAGQQAFCALGWSDHVPPATYDDAEARLAETRAYWHEWVSRGRFPDHPWQIHLQRSALTLKGLTYAPTGAMIAAATTSLPETPGGERNWDYRYSWLRDSTFMLWALSHPRLRPRGDRLLLLHRRPGRGRGPADHVRHRRARRSWTRRRSITSRGYEGARPVRVGNDAWHHRQHDVWGVLLDSVRLHTQLERSSRRPSLDVAHPPGRRGARALA